MPPKLADVIRQQAATFEVFPGGPPEDIRMPVIVYHDTPGDPRQQHMDEFCSLYTVCKNGVFRQGRIEADCTDERRIVFTRYPIAMSPAYIGFVVQPYEWRYLHYDGCGIAFFRHDRAHFMAPSVDTVLFCAALKRLFASGVSFSRAIDVGCGSSFIGKYCALHCPGQDTLRVDLVDIDPCAEQYARSWGFAAPVRQKGGRKVECRPFTADAIEHLRAEGSKLDLVLSNPPYIPTREECAGETPPGPEDAERFWRGVGMLCNMVDRFVGRRFAAGAHLVLVVSSLSLKAPAVREAIKNAAAKGCVVTPLLMREVAYKAWYAGAGGMDHLLATEEEMQGPIDLGGCKLWAGCSRPGRPRACMYDDGRAGESSYHWHFVQVLDFKFETTTTKQRSGGDTHMTT